MDVSGVQVRVTMPIRDQGESVKIFSRSLSVHWSKGLPFQGGSLARATATKARVAKINVAVLFRRPRLNVVLGVSLKWKNPFLMVVVTADLHVCCIIQKLASEG